ncbi:PIN domain-containing protein [Bifidobacterium margollesii]|uniref:PIN domain-containing protein n=1 Tax=Bifidobacterium margollesii TaxID=2020964 RepID=A0A2N5JBE2_9BIFI|nr:PIN domain-containing protein [Bifidobacterium margollesii]PLS31529.1 PIN domain-containing protein [Bifidobacterium margollesii]
MVIAFLDANIFPHTWLTDVLLTFADHHLFDPQFSDDVLEKARRTFVEDLGRDPTWVDRYLAAIRNIKPYYLVPSEPGLANEVVLPDPNDRHVAAAAHNGDADVIVTFNLKDFPANQLAKIGLAARHPDVFLVSPAEAHSEQAVQAMRELVSSKQHPPRSSSWRSPSPWRRSPTNATTLSFRYITAITAITADSETAMPQQRRHHHPVHTPQRTAVQKADPGHHQQPYQSGRAGEIRSIPPARQNRRQRPRRGERRLIAPKRRSHRHIREQSTHMEKLSDHQPSDQHDQPPESRGNGMIRTQRKDDHPSEKTCHALHSGDKRQCPMRQACAVCITISHARSFPSPVPEVAAIPVPVRPVMAVATVTIIAAVPPPLIVVNTEFLPRARHRCAWL